MKGIPGSTDIRAKVPLSAISTIFPWNLFRALDWGYNAPYSYGVYAECTETCIVELEPKRVMIGDTDNGKKLLQMIHDLKALLEAYRQGVILERRPNP